MNQFQKSASSHLPRKKNTKKVFFLLLSKKVRLKLVQKCVFIQIYSARALGVRNIFLFRGYGIVGGFLW